MQDIDATLKEREVDYGDHYRCALLRARIIQLILDRYSQTNDGSAMPKVYEVMLNDIVLKLSRLAVTPTHIDSIHDIAGYAKLYELFLHIQNDNFIGAEDA